MTETVHALPPRTPPPASRLPLSVLSARPPAPSPAGFPRLPALPEPRVAGQAGPAGPGVRSGMRVRALGASLSARQPPFVSRRLRLLRSHGHMELPARGVPGATPGPETPPPRGLPCAARRPRPPAGRRPPGAPWASGSAPCPKLRLTAWGPGAPLHLPPSPKLSPALPSCLL